MANWQFDLGIEGLKWVGRQLWDSHQRVAAQEWPCVSCRTVYKGSQNIIITRCCKKWICEKCAREGYAQNLCGGCLESPFDLLNYEEVQRLARGY